jgi:two-component sensor histidine kinase
MFGAIDGDAFVLTWRESGGPPITGPLENLGFGTETTARLAAAQLGGAIDYSRQAMSNSA